MANPRDSPGIPNFDTDGLFNLLGNEYRMQILVCLWSEYDPIAADNTVSFTELFELTKITDSGQFNYHLEKLLDRYIVKKDDGYTLSPVGLRLVQSIIAGAGQDIDYGPVEIDTSCRNCGGATVLTYNQGRVFHCCTNCDGNFTGDEYPDGALWGHTIPPAGLQSRTPEELMVLIDFMDYPRASTVAGRICPLCSGVLDHRLDICDEHYNLQDRPCDNCGFSAQVRWRRVCQVCKFDGQGAIEGLLKAHPAWIEFHLRNNIDFGYPYEPIEFRKMLEFEEKRRMVETTEEVHSTDPVRINFTLQYHADKLAFVLDEHLNVIEIIDHDDGES